jgi:LPXTG-motif cell wall-anchored protein
MNSDNLQIILWVGAAVVLILYIMRRRKRRSTR